MKNKMMPLIMVFLMCNLTACGQQQLDSTQSMQQAYTQESQIESSLSDDEYISRLKHDLMQEDPNIKDVFFETDENGEQHIVIVKEERYDNGVAYNKNYSISTSNPNYSESLSPLLGTALSAGVGAIVGNMIASRIMNNNQPSMYSSATPQSTHYEQKNTNPNTPQSVDKVKEANKTLPAKTKESKMLVNNNTTRNSRAKKSNSSSMTTSTSKAKKVSGRSGRRR